MRISGAIGALSVILYVLAMVALLGRSMYVTAECLSMGYAESDTTWNFKGYCVMRDYTGHMKSVPLSEAFSVMQEQYE